MLLQEIATNWLRSNCPLADMQAQLLLGLNQAIDAKVGCSFVIGPNLTRAGTPFLVEFFCGEMFVFQLTPQQATKLMVKNNELVQRVGIKMQNHDPRPVPPVRIDTLKLVQDPEASWTSPLTGTLTYSCEQCWSVPTALQIAIEVPGRLSTVLYHHNNSNLSPPNGVIQFAVSPPSGPKPGREDIVTGVLPMYFQICAVVKLNGGIATIVFTAESEVEALGTPYVATSVPQPQQMSRPLAGPTQPQPQRFRAISDIRAVLVDFV